jgi:Tfp pilus assembly protein PilZ
MAPACRPILVVSYTETTLDTLVSSLVSLGANVMPCETFCHAEQLALHESFSGILIDLTSIIKAKGEEKLVAYTLASIYPTLRVRVIGPMPIPMAMPGDAKQDNSLKDFVNRTCAEFLPRTLRMYRRRDKCVSTTIIGDETGERGFTLNISWDGAFIVSTHSERFTVGQEMAISLHELGLVVNVRVCWVQPWGQRHFSGYGIKFISVDEELEKALFQLLKHDRSIDRDRITG